ncbi:MAG TPA: ribose 5-phosphate isomerase B [Candidatus Omnitrophota bacterium]|nr:ribose 5-phosphate isomerase B [Candidatus Omnitrophota bacterium]
MKKKISIGCDHGGFALKEKIGDFLKKAGYQVLDFGAFSEESVDYPDTAYEVAKAVSIKKTAKGILICKSGIGNSIVANKVKNVRAALCYNIRAAKLSRMHNDANVLVLGALFTDTAAAKKMVKAWLKTPFEGGRHLRRIKKIERIEKLCAR